MCTAGEVSALQERLAARDAQLTSQQQELSLLQLHVREAQRAQGAAAEAQAAANSALDQQEAELAVLQQQLKEAQVSIKLLGSMQAGIAANNRMRHCHQVSGTSILQCKAGSSQHVPA